MPVHDWTRVVAGNFHDFHQAFIIELGNLLNGGLLPGDYYALAEQKAERPEPDILTLRHGHSSEGFGADDSHLSTGDGGSVAGGTLLAVADHPPQVEFIEQGDDADAYARKADRLAVNHASGDRVVAFVEIVSPGNKNADVKLTTFVKKRSELFERGCHLLLLDMLPPGSFDPQGVHAAFWGYREGTSKGVTADRPLGVSSYRAAPLPTAYFQPVAIGEPLPDMPLFLTPNHYINVPLDQTYLAAWKGVLQRWKEVLEAGSPS